MGFHPFVVRYLTTNGHFQASTLQYPLSASARAYDQLVHEVHRGHETPIDPYAATNPGEYFSVVSELHFSDPARLERAEPAVAALLREYYGPSPAP